MRRDEAQPLLIAAQHAAEWCRGKLETRTGAGGHGKEYEYGEAERTALRAAHSIAVCDVLRLQAIVNG
jgi:hypothetical protein